LSSKNKKSQITVFIIIGIIILAVFGIVYFINQLAVKQEAPVEISKIETSTQLEKAVKNYVDNCIKIQTLQGLEIIRLQGGYIDIPSNVETRILKDPNGEYVSDEGEIKRVVIDLSKEGNKVPYWVTKTGYVIPSQPYIRSHLEDYIEKGMRLCIDDFKSFKDQSYTVNYGTIKADVTFNDSVQVNINFPAEFIKKDINTFIEDYLFTIPINIPEIFDAGLTLALSETSTGYLEFATNNLWGLYSGVRQELLPPFRDERVNRDGTFVSWTLSQVESTFKDILGANINYVKIIGTDYPARTGIDKSFEFPILTEPRPNLVIDHWYLNSWDLFNFQVTPSPIKPDMLEELDVPFLPAIYVFKYEFKYSAEYPVLVEIKNTKSAKIYPHLNLFELDQGYKIQYFDYVAIYGSQPRQFVANPYVDQETGQANLSALGISDSDLADSGILVLPNSYFCDESQKLTKNITIRITDSKNNTPLDSVNVFYECGSYKNNCFIGSTQNGSIIAKMPLCSNGFLRMTKDQYQTKKERLTTTLNQSETFDYELFPIFKVNATIMKYNMTESYNNHTIIGNLIPLEEGDRVTFIIKQAGSTEITPTNTLIFGTEVQQNEVKLFPGDYEINAVLMTSGFEIESGCERICTNKDENENCTDYQYLPEDSISLANGTTLGGLNIDSSTGYWHVTPEMLNGNSMILYVLQLPQPTCIDRADGEDQECLIGKCIGLEELSKTANYSNQFKNQSLPRII